MCKNLPQEAGKTLVFTAPNKRYAQYYKDVFFFRLALLFFCLQLSPQNFLIFKPVIKSPQKAQFLNSITL